MKNNFNYSFLSFCIVVILFSCKQNKHEQTVDVNNLEHQCVHRLSDVIVYDIFSPPVASRIYAYSNLAYYEALRFQDSSSSLAAKLKFFDPIPQPEKTRKYDFSLAAVESFFKVAKALIFSKDSLVVTENKILNAFKNSVNDDEYHNSVQLGDTIAATILKRAANDNYNITRGMPKYNVFKEPGKWEQTPPDYADAVEPYWRLIKPFLLDSAGQYKAAPPPVYSLDKNSQYYKELMDVYTISKNTDPSVDTIAHYWDDNPFVTTHAGHLMFGTKKTTPGGHWMGIVLILCRDAKFDPVKTARTYALAASSIFDGFITCWDEKYRSRMVRPITVIREKIDPTWNSKLQTPSFPEYISAHSVVTGAVSTVLEKIFGTNTPFHDTTEMEYLGLQRSFTSIHDAADEAALSRLYGGIHYRSAIEEGKKQGRVLGKLYNDTFNQ
jgi:hypothetical protein